MIPIIRKLFLSVLCISFTAHIYTQDTDHGPISIFDIESSLMDLCDDKKHLYLNFNPPKNLKKGNISSIVVYPVDDPFQQKILTDNFETELYNLVPRNRSIDMHYKVWGPNKKLLLEQDFTISTDKDQSVVDVSVHMEEELENFKKQDQSLALYFCGKQISKVELLAFFQDYLKLSEEEMCEIIRIYERITQLQFEDGTTYDYTRWKLCIQLDEYLKSISGNGGNSDCNCELIRTNRTASNFGTDGYLEGNLECQDETPLLYTENHNNQNGDDDWLFSAGRLGAAKAAAFEIDQDDCWGSSIDGDDEDGEVTSFQEKIPAGFSHITYNSVCVNGEGLDPDKCDDCVKEINFNYRYSSKVRMKAKKGNPGVCGAWAYGVIYDWVQVIETVNDEYTIIDDLEETYRIQCGVPDDSPLLTEAISDIGGIIDDVTNALGGGPILPVIEGTLNFIDNIANQCNAKSVKSHQISGTHTTLLPPGGRVAFTMISGTSMGGFVENSGDVWGQIASDFYIGGVLKTIPDSEGVIPDHCECEIIGSYAIASLEDFSPGQLPYVDAPERIELDFDDIFELKAIGLHDLRKELGDFIGGEHDWQSGFEKACVCDRVLIPCQAECVTELCYSGEQYDESNQIEARSNQVFKTSIVYPNPILTDANHTLHLKFDQEKAITIYAFDGKLLYQNNTESPSIELPETIASNPGLYYIKVQLADGKVYSEKLIVQ